jgi:hypothetical protein
MAQMTCDGFRDLSAELSLGLLEGRERAAALAHAASCEACQHELTALGDVADELVSLTPAIEPPTGFETRVIAGLSGHRRKHLRDPFRRAWVLAAAAVVAAAVAIGGWALSGGLGESTAHYVTRPVSAPLMAGGHEMGEVMLVANTHTWLSMAVSGGPGNATVTCRLLERDGRTVTVGSFQLVGGEGYWAAAVPGQASDVMAAQLVAADGSTIATADLGGSSR